MLCYFLKGEPSSQLNGLFNSDGVNDILHGNDYQFIDMKLPSICAYVDHATEYIEDRARTNGDTKYSELAFELYSRSSKKNIYFRLCIWLMIRSERELKDTMVFC